MKIIINQQKLTMLLIIIILNMKVKDSNYIEYESKGYKNKTLSIKEHLCMIRPYLRDKINYHQTQGQ